MARVRSGEIVFSVLGGSRRPEIAALPYTELRTARGQKRSFPDAQLGFSATIRDSQEIAVAFAQSMSALL